MKISYNWLKQYIPQIPSTEKLSEIFTYHLCEVEGVEIIGEDTIFDINILPNRAHDLLSHYGVAKEIASFLNIDFINPLKKNELNEKKDTKLLIKIETKNCRRYMGRIVRNINVDQSPEWIKNKLESIGQRSINNIVDIANLVMFDCGQPTHVFDLDKLCNEKIIIREAKDDEEITTLDEKHLILKKNDMIIADEKSILAVAGIKGGKIAEVDNNTKNIVLEVANFDPVTVRKTAQRIGIFTDARKRFENDLSPELGNYAMKEFSFLIGEVCPDAVFEDIVDIYPQKQLSRKVLFSADRISKILGLNVTHNDIENILKKYNFLYKKKEDIFEIDVPVMRADLNCEEDMAEEIGRILGYDNIKLVLPKIDFLPKENQIYKKIIKARSKLLKEGYGEVITYAFRNKGEREVLESASDKKFLRNNLSDGLEESITLNQKNSQFLDSDLVKVFEIGAVFLKDKEEIRVAYGNKKSITEVTLDEYIKNSTFNIGEVEIKKDSNKKFKMWSLFPFIVRDIAIWIPEKDNPADLIKIFKEKGTELLVKEPKIFDSFNKDGRTSYAFRLIFQSYERTLTDEEISKIMIEIEKKIKENSQWEIR